MKKILYSVMALAIAAMTFTSCEDVPEPYPTPNGGGGGNATGALPYTSANLNTGWTLQEVTAGAQPWSKGNSYAQATGYQAWDGASSKSNKAVEGWLVSPAINTVGYENVKLSFNHTIRYANNVTGWEAYHKVYASTNFDGTNASYRGKNAVKSCGRSATLQMTQDRHTYIKLWELVLYTVGIIKGTTFRTL